MEKDAEYRVGSGSGSEWPDNVQHNVNKVEVSRAALVDVLRTFLDANTLP